MQLVPINTYPSTTTNDITTKTKQISVTKREGQPSQPKIKSAMLLLIILIPLLSLLFFFFFFFFLKFQFQFQSPQILPSSGFILRLPCQPKAPTPMALRHHASLTFRHLCSPTQLLHPPGLLRQPCRGRTHPQDQLL